MERNRELAKDVIIYGIGNIGNKFLMFLLFPVLMFFMEREELGSYDIPLEVVLFLLPIVTLQMRESTFRLLIDNKDESYRRHIISGTLCIEGVLFTIVLLTAVVMSFFLTIRYFHLIIVSIYAYSIYEIYSQAVRSVYSSKQFMLLNIINSMLIIVLVVLFFFVFKQGVEGLFWSNILARFLSIAIIEVPRREIVSAISFRSVSKTHIKEILTYALPLLWSAIAFALISSSGKFIVNYLYGDEQSGILAAAQKYMIILATLGTTFYQAWQVTAVKNYQTPGREKFFTEVFNKYTIVLCLLVLCISFGIRAFKTWLIGPEFYQSIDLLFIYCISAMFLCLAQFFETIYQCTKQTSKIISSIVSCAAVAPVLSFVLIKHFGVMGHLVTLTLSYAYLLIFRYFQTKSTLPIRLKKEFFYALAGLITGSLFFYFISCPAVDVIIFCAASLLLAFFLFITRKHFIR